MLPSVTVVVATHDQDMLERLGPRVEVLATAGNDPVVVREGKTMAATFHPELTADPRVHQAFLDLVQNGARR